MSDVKFRGLTRLLEDDGWQLTVAGKPGADVPHGTAARMILRQAALRKPTR